MNVQEEQPYRAGHHEFDLFSLKPITSRAVLAAVDPHNRHLVSIVNQNPIINIGYGRSEYGCNTLATLGRRGDILVSGSGISRIQCSFELMPKDGTDEMMVMFVDRSPTQSCKVFGENVYPLRYTYDPAAPRQVLVSRDLNTIIGMGGVNCDLIQFQLIWHGTPPDTQLSIKKRQAGTLAENPDKERTFVELETAAPSQIMTRIHTPGLGDGNLPLCVIHDGGKKVGGGNYGNVYRGYNVYTGQVVAVKVMETECASYNTDAKSVAYWRILKREMENMATCHHKNIVKFYGWKEKQEINTVEIYMALMEGSLSKLVLAEEKTRKGLDIADSLLKDMLQALDYLQSKGIVHRDLKPDNVLYYESNGQLVFQLADFGLSNRANIAVTRAGSEQYMAPEIFRQDVANVRKQTDRVDVWSLFVTILWVLNYDGFRDTQWQHYDDVCNFIRRAISSGNTGISSIKSMAIYDSLNRASAAQMLIKLFGGSGLTTSRYKVPPLPAIIDHANFNAFEGYVPLLRPQQHQHLLPSPPGFPLQQPLPVPGSPAHGEAWKPCALPPSPVSSQHETLGAPQGAGIQFAAATDLSTGAFGKPIWRRGRNRVQRRTARQQAQAWTPAQAQGPAQRTTERMESFLGADFNEAMARVKESWHQHQSWNHRALQHQRTAPAQQILNQQPATNATQPLFPDISQGIQSQQHEQQPTVYTPPVSEFAPVERVAFPKARMPGSFPDSMTMSWTPSV